MTTRKKLIGEPGKNEGAWGKGHYSTFRRLPNGDLKITLTKEGRKFAKELWAKWNAPKPSRPRFSHVSLLMDLLEEWLPNGNGAAWEIVSGEDLMWMYSDDCMFTFDPILDERLSPYSEPQAARYIFYSVVYHDPEYYCRLPLEELAKNGSMVFEAHESFESEADRNRDYLFACVMLDVWNEEGYDDTNEAREQLYKAISELSDDEVAAKITSYDAPVELLAIFKRGATA